MIGKFRQISFIYIVIFILTLVCAPFSLEGQTRRKTTTPKTSAEAKKRQAAAKKEIQLTEAQIKENEKNVSRGLTELGKLDTEISATRKIIKDLDGKIGSLNSEIAVLEKNISRNEKELEKLREEYLKAIKKMRLSRKNTSAMAFVFSSKSVSQALRRMRYLKEFSAWRSRQTDEINGKIELLKQETEALAQAREEQQSALASQKQSEKKLSAQHEKQKELVAELKKNGKVLESHLKRKQAEARELGDMVSQLIAREEEAKRKAAEEARLKAEAEAKRKAEEERKKAEAEAERKASEEVLLAQQTKEKNEKAGKQKSAKTQKTEPKTEKNKKETIEKKPGEYADARKRTPRSTASKDSDVAKSVSFPDMRGKLPSPSSGSFTITSRFGRQELPDLPGVEYDNPGIDAETEGGSFARAVYQGKVSGVYLLPGYNTVVIVNHGNYYTVYGNISNPMVKIGDQVDMGSNLGVLARSDDNSDRSSIHFEVWKNREKLNPQDWLR